jgi:aminoglycoside phosphotransferase (APT) family kinase protein
VSAGGRGGTETETETEAGTPKGIEPERVAAFFRERVPGGEGPLRFELLSGGRSNVTYRVHAPSGRVFVLRRPPLGHVLPTAHDMAREYRVLAALADTDVPVPRPFALCEDPGVTGAPFYVMEYRPGVVLEGAMPPGFADTPEARHRLSLALVDTLVALHAVDFRAVGLEGFGRPEGYLERQVRRWGQQWERSKTKETPAIEELLRRLRAALPASPASTIVHGDYRLGNLALDPSDPGRVLAIFDWEMATLGDPLADLGYTLGYWSDPEDREGPPGVQSVAPMTDKPGFVRRAELVEAYALRSGRDVSAIDFYRVLALAKLAVIAEGIWARHVEGQTLGRQFQGLRRQTAAIAERALALADASSLPTLRG